MDAFDETSVDLHQVGAPRWRVEIKTLPGLGQPGLL